MRYEFIFSWILHLKIEVIIQSYKIFDTKPKPFNVTDENNAIYPLVYMLLLINTLKAQHR